MGFDLSIGGETWAGWFFGKWSNAREWRLHAPAGATYTAGEIAELRPALLDLDFLSVRVRELTDYAAGDAMHFGPRDAGALIACAEMILRLARQLTPSQRRIA